MNSLIRIFLAALFSVLLFSCSSISDKSKKTRVTNPNGDSELALAMRKVFDQTEEMKLSLEAGEFVVPENYIENLKKFHTATPTDPEVKVEQFFGFIKAIDLAAKKLESSKDLDLQKEEYSRVVNACIQCHQEFCPGPIRRINKLLLPRNL